MINAQVIGMEDKELEEIREKKKKEMQENSSKKVTVYSTPTCPYCTMAVRLAHQFALVSPKIKADMVESTEFPHLAHKFNVAGVPKTVINETVTIDGAVPEDVFLEHVLKAAED